MSAAVGGGGRPATTYGLLRIGDARVALPLSVLREVIPCPPTLAPIPARAPGLRGAVNLRDVVIPVLDLAAALDWPQSERDNPVIVMISSGGRMLGVVADEVNGITTVPDDQRHDTRDAGGELILSHTFAQPEDGTVVSILDATAILAMPGVPTVLGEADGSAGARNGARAEGHTARPMMLVRCGTFRIAVTLTDIHTVLPQLDVIGSPLESELCRGVTDYREQLVPVVDLLRTVGLGVGDERTGAQGLLWRYPDGLVALQVSEVVEIVTLDEAEVRPLPGLGVPDPRWFRGTARIAGHGQHLVLDTAVVSADETLTALGRLNTARDGAEQGAGVTADRFGGSAKGLHRYLTYQAGVEVATPLEQIAEIVAYPDDVAELDGDSRGLVGIFTHRDHAVSLICLNRLTGRAEPTDRAASRVLLIEHDGDHIGFVVDALGAIELSVWEEGDADRPADPGGAPDPYRIMDRSPLVQIGADPDGRLLPRLDLTGLVAALSGRT